MPEPDNLIAFALIAFAMVVTPGPNMVYLISRAICQGRAAGMISLGGVALGFVFYMLCAAFGITALVMAIPFAQSGFSARPVDRCRVKNNSFQIWTSAPMTEKLRAIDGTSIVRV